MYLKTIETNRLLLKGFTPEDMNFIFENLPISEIKELLGHTSDEAFEKEALKQKQGYSCYNRSFVLFMLIEKKANKIIGRCGLHNWNKDHYRAEIGYSMEDEFFKNKGLMSEAVKAIIEYGFKELKLNRIEALVGIDNVPSLKIIAKNHFVKEGVLRKHYLIEEVYVDSVFFSLLAEEFLQQKEANC